jgi:hypothetical protein
MAGLVERYHFMTATVRPLTSGPARTVSPDPGQRVRRCGRVTVYWPGVGAWPPGWAARLVGWPYGHLALEAGERTAPVKQAR